MRTRLQLIVLGSVFLLTMPVGAKPLPSPVGAHTQCRSLPRSIPATLCRTTGSPAICFELPALTLRLSCIFSAFPNTTAQVGR